MTKTRLTLFLVLTICRLTRDSGQGMQQDVSRPWRLWYHLLWPRATTQPRSCASQSASVSSTGAATSSVNSAKSGWMCTRARDLTQQHLPGLIVWGGCTDWDTTEPVADPGFSRRGRQPQRRRSTSLLFGKMFPKNCMKMKEIGGGQSLEPPWIRHCERSVRISFAFNKIH